EQVSRHLQRQARLADAARTCQRKKPHARPQQQRRDGRDLLRPPNQRGGLRRQVGAVHLQGLERWKVGGQVRGEELEYVLGVGEVFELIPAQVTQRQLRRKLLTHQFLDGLREQDLAAVTGSQQARDAAERQPKIVSVARLDH